MPQTTYITVQTKQQLTGRLQLLEFEIASGNTGNLLEFSWFFWQNFTVSNIIFARRATFSTLYIGKSSGKQDNYDLGSYCMACHIKIFWNFVKTYPGYFLEICRKLVRQNL